MSTYKEIIGNAVVSKDDANAENVGQLYFDTATNKWYFTQNNGSTVKTIVTTN
jgi:hypothetical protein|tara:strand:+ start:42 stop:200 length:159 start_codon:yes stop_codon:yes gene_type:complete